MRAYVIANPKAGRGAVGDDWERLLAALHRAGLEPLGDLTQGPGHATELARAARTAGHPLVVAAGGDGTVHEVVNGLLADGPGPDVPELGLVAFGSGCDYVRTFALPAGLEEAAKRLSSDAVRAVDVGEIVYQTPEGPATRLFANIAEVGIGSEVVGRAGGLPRSLGAAVYFAAFWMTLPGFRRPQAEIHCDGTRHDVRMTNLVVAIGRYFGGGMRVAPDADPGDGLFDVQIQTGSKLDYVLGIPKVYRGRHVPHPRIVEDRASEVRIDASPPALIEADGEVLGHTPATFRILPRALRVKA